MDRIKLKREQAWKRSRRVRNRITGSAEKPRLSVFRSLRHIYAQLVDDLKGVTLGSCSTKSKDIAAQAGNGGNKKAAKLVGEAIAKMAKEKGITAVSFDRGAYKFHGRIKALAEGAREGGLKF